MQIISLIIYVFTSIYNLQFNNIDGGIVNMSSFQGKKILLVNIATGSQRISQLADLQRLHQQYGDSVVIIAFPSNSFTHEPKSNIEIKQFCQDNYGASFLIAEKNSVAGTTVQPVYNWLAHASENGEMDGVVGADFQKFLIDKNGILIGIFSPAVKPMDSVIQNAITEMNKN